MTDKKLTDAEIKEALECCILGDCQGCFYGDTDQRHCKDDLMQNALNLINRLQAENKRLKQIFEGMAVAMPNIAKAERHEAYKEFAERLCEDRVANDPVVIAAKCLLKELTEKTN